MHPPSAPAGAVAEGPGAPQRRRLQGLGAAAALLLTGLVVARGLLRPGFPPGVDTPLFLHLSWFVRETLRGAGGWTDPYWYGGFPYLVAYPPLSYVVTGVVAAIPGVGLVFVYKVVLLLAYVGNGGVVYLLGRELGMRWVWALGAGLVTLLAYPLVAAAGLWGWYSTVGAMPLGIAALVGLERAYREGRRFPALWGGVALGLSVLAHHMTGFAVALALPGWVLFYLFREPSRRPDLYRAVLTFVGATVLTTAVWMVPWLVHLLEVGFRREEPGLWTFPLRVYLKALTDWGLVGQYTYPSYVGMGLLFAGVGGVVLSLTTASRFTPYGILVLVLVGFSVGEQANPLVRVWPFAGLDVARFQLYAVPFAALLGAAFVQRVGGGLRDWVGRTTGRGWARGAAGAALPLLVLGSLVWDGALASQRLFQPYRVAPGFQEALDWFGQEGSKGKVLGVGFWNWDDFLLPYSVRRPVVDGWHDEGAANWREVRALRMMMWTGKIDVPQAHRLLGQLGGRFIVVQDYVPGESPTKFRRALREHPELFRVAADWGDVTIFERLSSS